MSLSREHGLVLIPAFNEAKHIQNTLGRVLVQFPRERVLVIDDGSTDSTGQLAEELGVNTLRIEHNSGKGNALALGFDMALKRFNVSYVITLDADGQHPPERIPDFLNAARGFDLLIGNRWPFNGMPLANRISNTTTSLTISVMTGQRLWDTQCGYRLIKASVLRAVHTHTKAYQAESELLVKAAWMGFRIGQVPIEVVYQGEKSHIRAHKDVPRAILLALGLLMSR